MKPCIEQIERTILPLRTQLQNHALYSNLNNLQDVQIFMEHHVYAVWDFMSLLKSLQQSLTCTNVPWMPGHNPVLARFINKIVHGEESDVNENGEPKSHFDMYLEAMHEIGASPAGIENLLSQLTQGKFISEAIDAEVENEAIRSFLHFSFDTIHSKKAHAVASAFTFGREDVIPDMFFEIVKNSQEKGTKNSFPKLTYYLERHIEVDGGEHGPLSLKMINELCGADDTKWAEAEKIAVQSLEHRILLWDTINAQILKSK